MISNYFKPHPNPTMRVISLAACVQSSVMALMAERGEITPKPDCAVFADTQAEPDEVYTHLEWLSTQLSYPIYQTTAGDLRKSITEGINIRGTNRDYCVVPFHVKDGFGRRQCTTQFKIEPIQKKFRQLLGVKKNHKVKPGVILEQWIGISQDELQRVKESRDKWLYNRWPLLELGMKRYDCQNWFAKYYPEKYLPRSACTFCPYKNNNEWRHLRDNDPKGWEDAVAVDKKIRTTGTDKGREQFVHRSLKPLDQADLQTMEEKGQLSFLDECDGMCGM